MPLPFAPSHRGGSGPPLVCLHGFTDTWRTWELVLPASGRHHDVLAVTLDGHTDGPAIEPGFDEAVLADAVEAAMDRAGMGTARLAGNSLGGFVALQLAARGRADPVVAFAPAGGWAPDDDSYRHMLALQTEMQRQLKAAAPYCGAPRTGCTVRDAAELLRGETTVIEELAEACELPGRRVGGQWRFSREALVRWLAA